MKKLIIVESPFKKEKSSCGKGSGSRGRMGHGDSPLAPGKYLACVSAGFVKDSVQMELSEIELKGHTYSSGIQVEG